ncbi:uncharacterized protein LOC129903601 [Solanum dulcamara]|uniref:uncharacterized protein LOC129903601 n=1 Tax=Solanum dulcamara TaxID=45834 RepID=UPI0024867E2F|nr:uncharacterized protein LOC129903601 [Solanum dulcamara]
MTMMYVLNIKVESIIDVHIEERFAVEPLAAVIMNFNDDDIKGYDESVSALQGVGSHSYSPKKLDLDLKNMPTPFAKPSIEEPPVLELKELPVHLSYVFLDYNTGGGVAEISIELEDQEKTTFSSPYGTFAFRRMPFGLWNALATF